MECTEYDNGPWASTGSDSCVDVAGHWQFLGPDVSTPKQAQLKPPIRFEWLEQGFLAEYSGHWLGFSNAVDAAEWLLGWLGFEDEIVESVRDILAGLWDDDELIDREELVRVARSARGIHADKLADKDDAGEVFSNPLLDIAEAAWAYIEAHGADAQYVKLAEAMKKWHPMRSRGASAVQVVKALDVVAAVLAYVNYVETGSTSKWCQGAFDKLAEAVKKWRMCQSKTV